MRRGPEGQLIILPWSPMHTAGTSLALVLQTQQQGQKWTKILQELPCLSLSIDISSLRKRGSIRFHVGFLSRAPLPFQIWETVVICIFEYVFPFTFLLMMLKKGVSIQRKMYLSLCTALVPGSSQAAAWNWLEKLLWLVLLLVFWGRKKLPAMITYWTQSIQSHKEKKCSQRFSSKTWNLPNVLLESAFSCMAIPCVPGTSVAWSWR